MFAFFFSSLLQVFQRASWSWIVIWVGLASLSIAIIVMMRTRWGTSQPIRKCIALSLLAHLLLAMYAMTIEIVSTGPGPSYGRGMHAVLWDNGPVDPADKDADDGEPEEGSTSKLPSLNAPDQPKKDDADAAKAKLAEPGAKVPDKNDPLLPLQDSKQFPQLLKQDTATSLPKISDSVLDAVRVQATKEKMAQVEPFVSKINPAQINDATKQQPALPDLELPNLLTEDTSQKPSPVHQSQEPTASSASPSIVAKAIAQPSGAQSSSTFAPANNTASMGTTPAERPSGSLDGHVPTLYADRFANDRKKIILSRGGSPESEAAVQKALKWLASVQSLDGHWDAKSFDAGQIRLGMDEERGTAGRNADTAMTGLALLAFLGSGNTHIEGEYKDNVRAGLNYLRSIQGQNGSLAGAAENDRIPAPAGHDYGSSSAMYSHGIASIAICESYALTKDSRLEGNVRGAIRYTLMAQDPTSGSWRYLPRVWGNGYNGDMSQLGWQLMALKSAEYSGVPIPASSKDAMLKFLKSSQQGARGGKAGYQPGRESSPTMSAEALVCRQFLGMTRDNPMAIEAAEYLLQQKPSGEKINLYYWYYGTLGMYQVGGEYWESWNQHMQPTLTARQVKHGSNAGSWDPDCHWGGYGGRVYSTALSTLCLEVYYRYLPLYQESNRNIAERTGPTTK